MKTSARLALLLVLFSLGVCLTPCHAADQSAAPPAAAPVAFAQVYEDSAKGFAFDVPAGWSVSMSGDTLLVNNQRPGLNLTYWNPGRGAGAGVMRAPDKPPEEIIQLLLPGEIWLKLTSSPGTNREPDSAVSEINMRLARAVAPTANPDLLRLSFSFYKHGHWFDCIAFLRSPVSDVEQGKLRTMLQNLRFMDKPVSNVTWATTLALQSLPAAVRDIKDPRQPGPPYMQPPPTVTLTTQSLEDAYLVTFTLNRMPPELGAAYQAGDTWKFLVSRDGTVTRQGVRSPTPPTTAKPPN